MILFRHRASLNFTVDLTELYTPRLRNQPGFNNLMSQATEFHYVRVFVVSEDVVDTASWPGL
jgi:hypothetical protein